MGFIPAGELMRELILALGAAMVVGSAAVIVRERRRPDGYDGPRPSMRIVLMNIAIGTVLAAWGLSSMIAAS